MKFVDGWIPPMREFITWLESLPPERKLGECQNPAYCPIVEWIGEKQLLGFNPGDDVLVSSRYIKVGKNYYLPDPWMRPVIELADDPDNWEGQEVTAGRLVELIKSGREKAMAQFRKRRGAAIHFLAVGDKPGWREQHGK